MRYDKVILELIRKSEYEQARFLNKKAYGESNIKLYNYYNALIYCARKDYLKAIELFRSSEEYGLNSDMLFYNIGVAFLEIKNFDHAETYLKKSINLNNNLTEAYQNLAHIFIKKGDIRRAYRTLKTCNSLNPNSELLSIEKRLLNQILKIS